MRLVVTGTPGVGKHTIAKVLADRLDAKLIDVNEVAFKYNAIIGRDYAYIIDIEKAKAIIKEQLSDRCIIVGHLAQDVVDEIDYAIVLRRSPYELEQVYIKRGYDVKKMKDNLASEILGVIIYDCMSKFSKDRIIEIDCTSKGVEDIVREIIMCISNNKGMIGVDWLAMVAARDEMSRFFDL